MLKPRHVRYLDIGAHHPTYLSNTYFFYERGANGVCIEPDPSLTRAFAKLRPRDRCLNIGVGPHEETASFYHMTTPALNTFSREHAERYQSYGSQRIERVTQVPVRNINKVIEENFEQVPELISLDVEGLDLAILQSLDFVRHRPLVFCVETLSYTEDRTERKLEEIIDWMKQQNYMLYADTYINSVFVERHAWLQRVD
jgi:FkbM family methyltransferase